MCTYYYPHRHRLVDLDVTFRGRGRKRTRPAAGAGPELEEALRPRDDFKAAYYAGGIRLKMDGAPMRVAGHVKDWSARSRGKITSYLTSKEFFQGRPRDQRSESLTPKPGASIMARRIAGLDRATEGRRPYD